MEERLTFSMKKEQMMNRLEDLFGDGGNYYIHCSESYEVKIYKIIKDGIIFGKKQLIAQIKSLGTCRKIIVYDEMVYFLMKQFGEEFGFDTLEMDYETDVKKEKKPVIKIDKKVAESILRRRLANGEIAIPEYNERMAYL